MTVLAGAVALDLQRVSVTYRGGARAVRDVSLTLRRGERVAVIGESGCGKSTLVRAVLDLLPNGTAVDGRIDLASAPDVTRLPGSALRAIRGRLAGYVPQNPAGAFDPLRSVGSQIAEAWSAHGERAGRGEVVGLLAGVGIADAEALAGERPAAWSGGMLQRAAIVAATALHPPLVLADEPTSAIDEDLAHSMLRFLAARSETLLVVTHDITYVADVVDRVIVMYGGCIVEDRPAAVALGAPRHPYTRALLAALPRPGHLPEELPGEPPSPFDPGTGCLFAPRCPFVRPACTAARPAMVEGAACVLPLGETP